MNSRPTIDELRSILSEVEKLIALGVAQAFIDAKNPLDSTDHNASSKRSEFARDAPAREVDRAVQKAALLQAAAMSTFSLPTKTDTTGSSKTFLQATDTAEPALIPTAQVYLAAPADKLTKIVELLHDHEQAYNRLYQQAQAQQTVQLQLDMVEDEADQLRTQVLTLHAGLRQASDVLENAIFQADQKIDAMGKVRSGELEVDDIIRYAHHISIHHSVAAPSDWVPGDQRRPYPTDLDMRAGWLGRISDLLPPEVAPPDTTNSLAANMFLSTHSSPHAWKNNQHHAYAAATNGGAGLAPATTAASSTKDGGVDDDRLDIMSTDTSSPDDSSESETG